MKRLMIGYRCFTGCIYSLVVLLIIPLLFIALQALMVRGAGTLSLTLISIYYMYIDGMADYFSFNGVTSRGYSFGLLQCSKRGRELVKNGIIADQLRRLFCNLAIMEICAYIAIILMPNEIKGDYLLVAALHALFSYSYVTFALILMRNITTWMYYGLLMGVVLLFGILGNVFMYLGYQDGNMHLMVWLFVFAFATVLSTFTMIRTVLKNYDRSFHEEIAG
ncbi:hypothetical protein [Butyrivibrio sp. AC2005]|uniref:hypothetical protein n=1 Tax=Butyrivibrio sp. AC2005 TaxID=1280672 RepID=UPI00040AF80D|nr:hypothetical protein [Butyrivibrio sp. AC2005]